MTCKASTRDPCGFERYENDDTFRGRCQTEKVKDDVPTHIAQCQKPFKRLFGTRTLSSGRHEVFHYDPRAPNDSLDFVIKATYNQHTELFPEKVDVVLQAETWMDPQDHGRILKNRVKEVVEPEPMHPLKVVVAQKERQSIHSVSNAIEGHHTQATNKGYSRNSSGGYFQS